MKKRMLQDVMGPSNLPPLSKGAEVLEFQIEQTAYFLDKMRAHESQFQQCFARDDRKGANKQRKRYVFNFAAFLSASRVFVYMLRGMVEGSSDGEAFVEKLTRTRPFRAFMVMRDANTHRVPLHYSLTYKVRAGLDVPLQGVMPARIEVNMLPFLEVTEPPGISLDLNRVKAAKSAHLIELASFIVDDERRNSLTYLCSEFLDEMRAGAVRAQAFFGSGTTPTGESEI